MTKPKGKGKGKRKNALPQEFVDEILRMNPKDLAAEAAREQLSLEALKKQLKEDPQISDAQTKADDLKKQVKQHEEDLDRMAVVSRAKEAYEEAKEKNMDDDHQKAVEALVEADADVKALKSSWNEDLKKRKETVKLMMKTLKSHLESGALKTKL